MASTVIDTGRGFELPPGAGSIRAMVTVVDMGGAPLFGRVRLDELALVNGIGHSTRPDDPEAWFEKEIVLQPGSYAFELNPAIGRSLSCMGGSPRGWTRASIKQFVEGSTRPNWDEGWRPKNPTIEFAIWIEGTENEILLVRERHEGRGEFRDLYHKLEPRSKNWGRGRRRRG